MGEKNGSAIHALGNVYIRQARYDEAYEQHLQSYQVRIEVLGKSHQTAASYHKLAWHRHRMQDCNGAMSASCSSQLHDRS